MLASVVPDHFFSNGFDTMSRFLFKKGQYLMQADLAPRSVLMLGTFGMRPKATMRSRALALARTMSPRFAFSLVTTPWDNRADAGKRWSEEGIDVVNTKAVRPALFPFAVREMISEFDRRSPDLIHLFKPKGFGDLAARRLKSRVPIVVDMDDWEGNGGWNDIGGYSRMQRALFDWQERTWPRMADAITVASRALEQRAVSLGADPNDVFYIPNGLTSTRVEELAAGCTSREATRTRLGLHERRIVLLYTRFVEFDPRLLVEVISRVRVDVNNATLVIVGASPDGQPERILHAEALAAGVATSIRLLGWVEPQDIPGFLAAGDVAIHPFEDTTVNRSKCSVKLLELMAAGLPVVTNRVGENAQMIEHERSGVLANPGDAAAMAAAVVDLLRNPGHAGILAVGARERVESTYLWDQLAPQVETAYHSATAHRLARSRP